MKPDLNGINHLPSGAKWTSSIHSRSSFILFLSFGIFFLGRQLYGPDLPYCVLGERVPFASRGLGFVSQATCGAPSWPSSAPQLFFSLARTGSVRVDILSARKDARDGRSLETIQSISGSPLKGP